MREVREFGLARPEEGRAAFAAAADVGKRIKQHRPGMLTDGAQFGVGGSLDGVQLGDWYFPLNVRSNSKAGQTASYHLARIEAVVNRRSQHQIDRSSLCLEQAYIIFKIGVEGGPA